VRPENGIASVRWPGGSLLSLLFSLFDDPDGSLLGAVGPDQFVLDVGLAVPDTFGPAFCSSVASPDTAHATVSPGGIRRERCATGRWGYHPSALIPPTNHPVRSHSFRTASSNAVVLSSGTVSGVRHSTGDSEGRRATR
jgi:hypothetical protein